MYPAPDCLIFLLWEWRAQTLLHVEYLYNPSDFIKTNNIKQSHRFIEGKALVNDYNQMHFLPRWMLAVVWGCLAALKHHQTLRPDPHKECNLLENFHSKWKTDCRDDNSKQVNCVGLGREDKIHSLTILLSERYQPKDSPETGQAHLGSFWSSLEQKE